MPYTVLPRSLAEMAKRQTPAVPVIAKKMTATIRRGREVKEKSWLLARSKADQKQYPAAKELRKARRKAESGVFMVNPV